MKVAISFGGEGVSEEVETLGEALPLLNPLNDRLPRTVKSF